MVDYKYTKDRATKTDSHRQTWTKQQARVVKKTYFCVACPLFGCMLNVSGGNMTYKRQSHKDGLAQTDLDKTASKSCQEDLFLCGLPPVWLHVECKCWKHDKYTKDRATKTDSHRQTLTSKQELSRRLIFVWPAPVWLHVECKWWKHDKYTKDRATKTDSHRQTWTKQQCKRGTSQQNV